MQEDVLWDDTPPQFWHLPVIVTKTMERLITHMTTACNSPHRLLLVDGPSGVGKSTAVWYALHWLQQHHPEKTYIRFFADESMTVERCLQEIQRVTHFHPIYSDPAHAFQETVQMRRVTSLWIDDAHLLPQATRAWLHERATSTNVAIGLIGIEDMQTLQELQRNGWQRLPYPPPSLNDIRGRFLPRLSPYQWFLPWHHTQYAPLSRRVAESANKSLRTLYQILFCARWYASLDESPFMQASHLESALSIRKTKRGSSC
jgi:AAA domain